MHTGIITDECGLHNFQLVISNIIGLIEFFSDDAIYGASSCSI